MIIIAGQITIEPEHAVALNAAIDDVVRASLTEPGCLEYVFSAHRSEPGIVHVFERWEDEQAIELHGKTDHYRAFGRSLRGMGLKSVELQKFQASAL
jgi:quinol monooxygenase YgiN